LITQQQQQQQQQHPSDKERQAILATQLLISIKTTTQKNTQDSNK
jgi:hypothetical protein